MILALGFGARAIFVYVVTNRAFRGFIIHVNFLLIFLSHTSAAIDARGEWGVGGSKIRYSNDSDDQAFEIAERQVGGHNPGETSRADTLDGPRGGSLGSHSRESKRTNGRADMTATRWSAQRLPDCKNKVKFFQDGRIARGAGRGARGAECNGAGHWALGVGRGAHFIDIHMYNSKP